MPNAERTGRRLLRRPLGPLLLAAASAIALAGCEFDFGDTQGADDKLALSARPKAIVAADFDRDGTTDLLLGHGAGAAATVTLLRQDGYGFWHRTEPEVTAPAGEPVTGADLMAVTDLDGDGRPDVVAAARGTSWLTLLANAGDGRFSSTREDLLYVADITALASGTAPDGTPLVAAAYRTALDTTLVALFAPRDGSLELVGKGADPIPAEATALLVHDVDGDGIADLLVGTVDGRVLLVEGTDDPTALARTVTPLPAADRSAPVIALAAGDVATPESGDFGLAGGWRVDGRDDVLASFGDGEFVYGWRNAGGGFAAPLRLAGKGSETSGGLPVKERVRAIAIDPDGGGAWGAVSASPISVLVGDEATVARRYVSASFTGLCYPSDFTLLPTGDGTLPGAAAACESADAAHVTVPGRRRLAVPETVAFEPQPVGTGSPTRTLELRAVDIPMAEPKSAGAVEIAGVRIEGDDAEHFAVEAAAGSCIATESACRVQVAFRPRSRGPKQARLVIDSDAHRAAGVPPHAVTLTGTATGPALSAPESLELGEVAVGTTATAPLPVRNDGEAPLTIAGASLDPSAHGWSVDVGTCVAPVAPGARRPRRARALSRSPRHDVRTPRPASGSPAAALRRPVARRGWRRRPGPERPPDRGLLRRAPTNLPRVFGKILIANRGEIAVRVMRACEELGIATVAVYSELDRDAVHVRRADEAYLLGPGPAAESYLRIDKILDVARRSGAEAIHPGYGFLAENAAFATACEEAGITFIGPPASAIEAMGSKTAARDLMRRAGVPIVPGTTEPVKDVATARKIIAETIGYPVAIKAAGGGGGKGFRVALGEDELEAAFEGAAREGEKFFSDPTVYIERYLPDPRHVEVQVLADRHGNVIHLGERDCSVQRRHQKLIEESPAPAVDAELREKIGKIATDAAAAVHYVGAGTIEGLLQDGEYYFLEMNTRVQVEHCVTEMTTGIDIVKEGIRAAAGEPLSVRQEDVVLRGHAIECRINAEDAAHNFAPAPGTITTYREPSGPGVRVDSGVEAGTEVSPMYDPMVAKLIVWDVNRASATRRMLRALSEYEIGGLKTLLPFHKALLSSEQWADAQTCRDLIEDRDWLRALAFPPPEAADGDAAPTVERSYTVEVSGRRFDVRVIGEAWAGGGPALNGAGPTATRRPRRERRSGGGAGGADELASPMQGNMWRVKVREGDTVEEGQLLCIIEAMKMENEITAHKAGVIASLPISEGKPIAAGDTIAVITAPSGE